MSDADIQLFIAWLKENGAKYPKIQWPTDETQSGVRGAIALDDINPMEAMIEIPMHLMMCPPNILRDPDVGQKLQSCMDLLQGDLLLSVYIMHEMRKGNKSFHRPFLRILPELNNISEWSAQELHDLQVRHLTCAVLFRVQ